MSLKKRQIFLKTLVHKKRILKKFENIGNFTRNRQDFIFKRLYTLSTKTNIFLRDISKIIFPTGVEIFSFTSRNQL